MEQRLYITLLMLLALVQLFGQDPYHIVYDVNNGLPSSEVYDVEIDKFNNIWFSTDRGLSRYNGYEFENFTTNDGLTDNTIFEIIKDNNENLWFSCYDGSVCYYDYESFKEAPFNEELKKNISRNWIRQMYFDQEGNFNFFLGKSTNKEKRSCYYKYYTKEDSLICIVPQTNKEYLRIGDSESNDFYFISSINYFTQIANRINDSTTLVGFTPETNFVYRNKDKKQSIQDCNSQIYLIEKNENTRLIFDDHSNMVKVYNTDNESFVLTDKGLVQIMDFNGLNSFKRYFSEYSCSSMIKDSENNIWITTINKGVILIPAKYIEEYDNKKFKDSRILAIEHLKDHLVISTFRGDVFSLDRSMNIEKELNFDDLFLYLYKYNDRIYTYNNTALYENGSDIKIDITPRNIYNYSKLFLKVDDTHYLRSTLDLSWSEITQDGGLINTDSIYTSTRPISLFCDKENKIWIGTLEGLYWIDDYKENKLKAEKVFTELELGRVSTIRPSNLDITFIGTIGQGLFFYSKELGTIKKIAIEDERSTNIINCLFEENDSTLWIGSNNGLFRTRTYYKDGELELKLMSHFNTRNGLSSNFIYDIDKWDSKFWIASEKGLNAFDPMNIPERISAPEIYFDSITSNHTLLDPEKMSILEHDNKNLSFHYSSNSFKKNLYNEFYKYTLLKANSDTVWKYANNRVVQFTNLTPGKYEFIVKARNQLDNWSAKPARFKFQILPHFSQTLIFKVFLFMGVMVLSYLMYYFRSRRVLANEVQKRKLQASEMRAQRAELNALRGQMNPHFIFNALNSIQNYIHKGDRETANYYMTKFSKLMRNSLEMSKLQLITIKDEIKFLSTYLELEKMRFEDKFNYKILLSENLDDSTKIPPLLIQPLVENSIKHGFKNIDHAGKITIEIDKYRDHLLISVTDNGTGFKSNRSEMFENERHSSLSIQIIKERLQIINAQNNSFEASLSMESPYYKDRKIVKGTKVEISLPYFN